MADNSIQMTDDININDKNTNDNCTDDNSITDNLIDQANSLLLESTNLSQSSAKEQQLDDERNRLERRLQSIDSKICQILVKRRKRCRSNIKVLRKLLRTLIKEYNRKLQPTLTQYEEIKRQKLKEYKEQQVEKFRSTYEKKYDFCATLIELQKKRQRNSIEIRKLEAQIDQDNDNNNNNIVSSIVEYSSSNEKLEREINSILQRKLSNKIDILRSKAERNVHLPRSHAKLIDYMNFSCEGIYICFFMLLRSKIFMLNGRPTNHFSKDLSNS